MEQADRDALMVRMAKAMDRFAESAEKVAEVLGRLALNTKLMCEVLDQQKEFFVNNLPSIAMPRAAAPKGASAKPRSGKKEPANWDNGVQVDKIREHKGWTKAKLSSGKEVATKIEDLAGLLKAAYASGTVINVGYNTSENGEWTNHYCEAVVAASGEKIEAPDPPPLDAGVLDDDVPF